MEISNILEKATSYDLLGLGSEIPKLICNLYMIHQNKKEVKVSALMLIAVKAALNEDYHSFKIDYDENEFVYKINNILGELGVDDITIIANRNMLSGFVKKFKASNLVTIETVNGDGCTADIDQFYCTFEKHLTSFLNERLYKNETLFKTLDMELQKLNYNSVEDIKAGLEEIKNILLNKKDKLEEEARKGEENKNNILVISRGEFDRDDYSEILDLREYFNDRFIKNIDDWKEIKNRIHDFSVGLKKKVNKDLKNYMYLSAHLSIAYCIGACFNDKGMYNLNPMQKTNKGILDWSIDSSVSLDDFKESMFKVTNKLIDKNNTDIVISISTMTKPLYDEDNDGDLNLYLEANKIPVRRIIDFNIRGKGGNFSVKNGFHARMLAEQVRKEIDNLSIRDKKGKLHIFLAAPVSLAFFLGQVSFAFNNILLYEFTGKNVEEELYVPSIFIQSVDGLS